jgi:glycosyltransferase involved in cell wall biosynthesis
MRHPVVIDLTRLATRVLNRTPNGIDRVDYAYASHFLAEGRDTLGLINTPVGARILRAEPARAIVEGIAAHWGEQSAIGDDKAFERVAAWLGRAALAAPRPDEATGRIETGRSGQVSGVLAWTKRFGLPLGKTATRDAPREARYVNVSQFPLWIPSYYTFLADRPDLKGVFFIHDLLPLDMPEYFRPAEQPRHARRMTTLAGCGSAAIVATGFVKTRLDAHLSMLGRSNLPIMAQTLPVSAAFRTPPSGAGGGKPYFVTCGTIEPRKNHLLLLHVWRELVLRDGDAAPRLVVVGNRGWENENVVDLLDRSPVLRGHVLEVAGLTTPGLRRLFDGARAVLMPSFGEGFGLPVAEALAAHVPVIASDIAPFREIGGDAVFYLSPIDGEGWLAAIRDFTDPTSTRRADFVSRASHFQTVDWDTYFERVEAFLDTL